jgi:hypothetical protein
MGILQGGCVLAVLALAGSALAHGRYPPECCSDHDCRPALPGEIEMMPDGRFLVVPTGEIFTRSQVRPSFDGHFHRCLYDPSKAVSRTFCVLVPGAS